MAVRGTIFDFHVEHNRLTSVVLFEGKVILCTLKGECEEMEDLCSLSRTERSRISVLFFYGEDRNSELRNDFPYVVNQRPLREDFRAPIESCGDLSEPPSITKVPNSLRYKFARLIRLNQCRDPVLTDQVFVRRLCDNGR